MIRLVYESRFVEPPTVAVLAEIFELSLLNNARDGVTGMLICCGSQVMQILEGPDEVVSEKYTKIARDPRHCDITEILKEPINHQSFPKWDLGAENAEAIQELTSIDMIYDLETLGNYFGMLANEPITEDMIALSMMICEFLKETWGHPQMVELTGIGAPAA